MIAGNGVADGQDKIGVEEGDFTQDSAVDLGFGSAGAVPHNGEMKIVLCRVKPAAEEAKKD